MLFGGKQNRKQNGSQIKDLGSRLRKSSFTAFSFVESGIPTFRTDNGDKTL